MSTFVLSVSDTIASCDTSFVKVENLEHLCQPIFQEAGTNWQDVAIVFCICAAIVTIAMYGICRFFTDKTKEREFLKERETQKRNWEVEDKDRKENAEQKNRSWSLEDHDRKQKEDLLNKKLQLLKDLCYEQKKITESGESKECTSLVESEESKDGKENKGGKENRENRETKEVTKTERVLRAYDSQEIKDYINALSTALSTTTKS